MPLKEQSTDFFESRESSGTTTGTNDALVHRNPGEDLKLKQEKLRGGIKDGFSMSCVQQAGQAGHMHSHQIKGKKALTCLEAKEDD